MTIRDFHRLIQAFFERFPLFFAEKRYKLINFAPKSEIVDKRALMLIINR